MDQQEVIAGDSIDITDLFNIYSKHIDKNVITNVSLKIHEDEGQVGQIRPLAVASIGLYNTSIPFDRGLHFWTDIDVHENYLLIKPACYIILGKPGVQLYSLGEAVSKKYNCVHICPQKIIEDELLQDTETWKCIDFNLRHKRNLTYKYILDILKIKIKSAAVVHRGYVITGLPLIGSSIKPTEYMINLYSESAVSFAQNFFEELLSISLNKHGDKTTILAEGEEDEDENIEIKEISEDKLNTDIKNISNLDPCCGIIIEKKGNIKTKSSVILNQATELFHLTLDPNFVIYVTCPDEDLASKRKQKCINYVTSAYIITPFCNNSSIKDIQWPSKYSYNDFIVEMDNSKYAINHYAKYNCRHPRNFTKNIFNELCNYKRYCLPYVEKKIQDFNPNNILKLDGRCSINCMMHTIEEKLLLMPMNPILIPQPLGDGTNANDNDNDSDDIEEFWNTVQNINIATSGNLRFNFHPSFWYNRCPVELKYGRSIRGNSKYAATLFSNVYLLSSAKALSDFCLNPRRFLKLQYLEPTCRVIIIGSKKSGKSMASACLQWLFDSEVIEYDSFYDSEKKQKELTVHGSILLEIMPLIEDIRLKEWLLLETERKTNLSEWLENTYHYIKNLESLDKCSSIDGDRFPFLNDDAEVQRLLSDKRFLLKYAPENLRYPAEKPAIPVLGDTDVTQAILNHIEENNLESNLEPTPQEVVTELRRRIINLDDNIVMLTNGEKKYNKWVVDGFPVSTEYWDELVKAKLLPDYIVCIYENREIDLDLFTAYQIVENADVEHSTRFGLANDPLICEKILTKQIPEQEIKFENIVNSIIDNAILKSETKNDDENTTDSKIQEEMMIFNEAVDKFRENWDSLKILLEVVKKTYIEVEIEDKTDIQVLEDMLLKMRTSFNIPCQDIGDEDLDQDEDNDPDNANTPRRFLGETGIYCPIEFYKNGVLWQGKPEFSLKYNNNINYFANEENSMVFKMDPTIIQRICKPFKHLPPLRICIIGCVGSGRTTVSKLIAKELGLLHIDFSLIANNFLIPPHCKKVGRQFENIFTDAPFDEEAVTDFKDDEEGEPFNFDDISETTIRSMVYDYFEKCSPLPARLLKKLLKKIWFEEPYLSTGFVLDGFPRLTNDIEEMINSRAIPDLILELEVDSDTSLQRLSPVMFKTWKEQLNKVKTDSKEKYDVLREAWFNNVTKLVVGKLIFNQLENNVFSNSLEPGIKTSEQSLTTGANKSGVMDVGEEDLINAYTAIVEEFPEPVYETEWENPEDAQSRIEERIEVLYQSELENIEPFKEMVVEQRIKVISIDGKESIKKVMKECLLKMSILRSRNESFFEQSFEITIDIAETLLSKGYYFLSQFNRQCPVFIFENPCTMFNFYKAKRDKSEIFPVIHRSYIYFLGNKQSSTKFQQNPLKYITSNAIEQFISFPLRVGIIGPPKSGKSTLAARFEKQFKLVAISRGLAVRHILDNLWWTDLAKKIRSILISGDTLSTDLIMQAVQTLLVDHRAITQGFVFDGFPSTIPEAMLLMKVGLYPFVMFDLRGTEHTVLNHAQNDIHYEYIKRLPAYSQPFIAYRFIQWQKTHEEVRKWIANDYQNLYTIPAENTRWECWAKTEKIVEEIVPRIHKYLTNVMNNAVSLDCMCISNIDFNSRASTFKNFCPVCLGRNVLRQSNDPVQRCGLIQYRGNFYWSCSDHMDTILANPKRHLIKNKAVIPNDLPSRLTYYNLSKVYENGTCMVTYAQNLPAQILIKGSSKFAAGYLDKVYLFCTNNCLDKFMETPQNFYDIKTLKKISLLPQIIFKDLPHIGYLEQTLGNILTEACCNVNVVRPKYPGLDTSVSGLILVALYLKTRNCLLKPEDVALYLNAKDLYEVRCKIAVKTGLLLRSRDNPFTEKYPLCCQNLATQDSGTVMKPSSCSCNSSLLVDEQRTRRVPVPDERFDYLCEFHKPASKVPAFLNVVDIAGLVKGAAEGQGLGNAFLSHIKACDAIFNLCRAFEDDDVIHVDGEVNPVRDLETIGEELRLKDEEQLLQNLDKLERTVGRGTDKKLKTEYDALLRIKAVLVDEKKHIRFGDWSAADIEVLNKYLYLTSKPALYLVNLSEKDYIRKKNKWLPKLKEWIDKNDPGAPLIPFSGALETKLFDMDPEEAKAYLKENNATCALDKIIVQGYKALQLEYFFTAGPDEVKAWTVQKGTKAPQAAGRIHTDFEKGFIMAEVMHFKDFKEEGTEAACKAAGKYRQQGRNYTVEDGDIIFFKFNAGAGIKDAKKK